MKWTPLVPSASLFQPIIHFYGGNAGKSILSREMRRAACKQGGESNKQAVSKQSKDDVLFDDSLGGEVAVGVGEMRGFQNLCKDSLIAHGWACGQTDYPRFPFPFLRRDIDSGLRPLLPPSFSVSLPSSIRAQFLMEVVVAASMVTREKRGGTRVGDCLKWCGSQSCWVHSEKRKDEKEQGAKQWNNSCTWAGIHSSPPTKHVPTPLFSVSGDTITSYWSITAVEVIDSIKLIFFGSNQMR